MGKKDMSNKGSSNVENIFENEVLRKQIGQLKNQVDFLDSIVLKLQSDNKNEGSERGMESEIHLRHENHEILKCKNDNDSYESITQKNEMLGSIGLKLQSDNENEGSERGMESDIHLRHENSETMKCWNSEGM